MAQLGFYDIRTTECLTRELTVKHASYRPLYAKKEKSLPAKEGAEEETKKPVGGVTGEDAGEQLQRKRDVKG